MYIVNSDTPIAVDALPNPAKYLCLDLETDSASEEDIEAAVSAWKAPGNWKPETVEAKRVEAGQKIREKSALLDSAPILCVSIQTERENIVFDGMDTDDALIPDWRMIRCVDERHMLRAMREYFDIHCDEFTVIIGQNVKGFDLPKLRHAYVRHRLRLPRILEPKLAGDLANEVVDIQFLFKAFSTECREDRYIPLTRIATGLGIPLPKAHVSGADIPRLREEGECAVILTYCAIDTATTMRAFQLMTSSAADLE